MECITVAAGINNMAVSLLLLGCYNDACWTLKNLVLAVHARFDGQDQLTPLHEQVALLLASSTPQGHKSWGHEPITIEQEDMEHDYGGDLICSMALYNLALSIFYRKSPHISLKLLQLAHASLPRCNALLGQPRLLQVEDQQLTLMIALLVSLGRDASQYLKTLGGVKQMQQAISKLHSDEHCAPAA